MDVWVLVLFLAGQKVEPPGFYKTEEACIEAGQKEVADYRKYHKHSRAWFWCPKGKQA